MKIRRHYPQLLQFFCNVIGKWIFAAENVKCAHIVPLSFGVKELPYVFGTGGRALESPIFGLMLQAMIKDAFDNGEVAIVPHGSVQATPTPFVLASFKDVGTLSKIVCFPTRKTTQQYTMYAGSWSASGDVRRTAAMLQ